MSPPIGSLPERPSSPLPAREGSTQRTGSLRSGRKSMGPMDSWISIQQGHGLGRNNTPPEEETVELIPRPSFSFGKPDLRASSKEGDGGRGIFPSASDKVRHQTNNELIEDDDISYSEDEEPTPKKGLPKDKRVNPGVRPSPYDNRQRVARNIALQNFFNKPFKTPSKAFSALDQGSGIKLNQTTKIYSTTFPAIAIGSLPFRARLVEECLYYCEDDAAQPPITSLELKQIFTDFLQRYVKGIDYSENTELELLQDDILEGKEFDIVFRNLAAE
ncbi:hypothetical protein ABW19_dt0207530 [Dactylella cylindrospora]|nr:hypothetical protein ABW19_dt0207530 [Dactylella cylindrospora]